MTVLKKNCKLIGPMTRNFKPNNHYTKRKKNTHKKKTSWGFQNKIK